MSEFASKLARQVLQARERYVQWVHSWVRLPPAERNPIDFGHRTIGFVEELQTHIASIPPDEPNRESLVQVECREMIVVVIDRGGRAAVYDPAMLNHDLVSQRIGQLTKLITHYQRMAEIVERQQPQAAIDDVLATAVLASMRSDGNAGH